MSSDTETLVDYVTVDPPAPPVAAFTGTPLSGDAPLNVAFTDASTGATSWSWDFGDGGTSNAQSPNYVDRYPAYLRSRIVVIPNPVYPAERFAEPSSPWGVPTAK